MNNHTISRSMIILATVVTLLTLIIVFIVYSPTNSPSVQPVSSTPAPTANPASINIYQLIAIMPVTQPTFDVEYLPVSQEFIVTITQSPYEVNKEVALQWFRNKGIDPDQLKITWNSYRFVE